MGKVARMVPVSKDEPITALSQAEQLRALVEADPARKGPGCGVCAMPTDVLAMVHTLRESGKAWTSIARNLVKVGFKFSPQTLGYHYNEGHGK
jgi:hypothetical protein